MADSQPPQTPQSRLFFDLNFTFCVPKSHKNPGVGGWVNTFGTDVSKKQFFLLLPLFGPTYKLLFQELADDVFTAPENLKMEDKCHSYVRLSFNF